MIQKFQLTATDIITACLSIGVSW